MRFFIFLLKIKTERKKSTKKLQLKTHSTIKPTAAVKFKVCRCREMKGDEWKVSALLHEWEGGAQRRVCGRREKKGTWVDVSFRPRGVAPADLFRLQHPVREPLLCISATCGPCVWARVVPVEDIDQSTVCARLLAIFPPKRAKGGRVALDGLLELPVHRRRLRQLPVMYLA